MKTPEEIFDEAIQAKGLDIVSVKDADLYEAGLDAIKQALSIANVSGMLPDQTKRHIDLAYLTGVFNVVGIDGLQKELTRLKEIGKNPHDIFTEGNYR